MADRGHHGEGQHDERDVAVPTMPGTGLVVIEAEFVLGGFEAVLDRPAMAFDFRQLFIGVPLGPMSRRRRDRRRRCCGGSEVRASRRR